MPILMPPWVIQELEKASRDAAAGDCYRIKIKPEVIPR